jgi:hypothetical protein
MPETIYGPRQQEPLEAEVIKPIRRSQFVVIAWSEDTGRYFASPFDPAAGHRRPNGAAMRAFDIGETIKWLPAANTDDLAVRGHLVVPSDEAHRVNDSYADLFSTGHIRFDGPCPVEYEDDGEGLDWPDHFGPDT